MPAPPTTIRTFQCGLNWFPERPGGLDRFYYHLVQRLPEVGVSARGMVAGSPRVAEDSGGRVEAFAPADAPLPARWRGARRLARRVLAEGAEGGVDLVVAHFALYALPMVDLVRSRPLLFQFQGPWSEESRMEGSPGWVVQLKRGVEVQVFRRVDRFMVLSDAFRQVLHRSYGVPLERISQVPGGVDAPAFDTGLSREAAREHLGWPTDRPVVLAVRRLARRMGLENLIEAMPDVRRAVPEALLLVAGKGPLKQELEARIEALGLGENVRLLGFVADEALPVAYRAADVTVVPTVALEGFGLIVVESLAAGTPVLVTPVSALPEIMRGLAPQLIVPDASTASLSEGLTGVLQRTIPVPDEAACQAYARTHYDWSVVAAREREIYEDVLA